MKSKKAPKKSRKATKRLKRSKKLEATKPLMVMSYTPQKQDGSLDP